VKRDERFLYFSMFKTYISVWEKNANIDCTSQAVSVGTYKNVISMWLYINTPIPYM
jgi:hypothetical protein